MISVEAYRAAVGRFSRKPRCITQAKALKREGCIDAIFLVLCLTLVQLVFYGLFITTIHACLDFIMPLSIVTSVYCYSYWMIKHTCSILCITFKRMSKRNELMRIPSPPKGVKVPTLIPCNYLDTFVLDGRCKCLDVTIALDCGGWEDKPQKLDKQKCQKLIVSVTNFAKDLLCYVCNVIICTATIYIGIGCRL